MVGEELDVGTIDLDTTRSLLLQVLLTAERGEAPVLGDDDLLATGELVLRSSQSLKSDSTVWHMKLASGSIRERADLHILESRVRTLMMI